MVVNMRNKRLWISTGLTGLVLILALTLVRQVHIPANSISSGAATQQKLEKSIVTKLEEKQGQKGFFAEYRIERESLRDQEMEMLGRIVNDSTADRVARQAASGRLVQISEDMEKEMKVENLVKSRGFNDCVLISQANDATLVVSASRMSAEQEDDLRRLLGRPGKNGDGKVYITLIEP